ncbi:MAG: NAD(P)H-hydrate dehydratase [Actinomycetota bacterium]|nr:MAG: NAD(P)H-hydrate dehydratase [Actinomycetota bacterium]
MRPAYDVATVRAAEDVLHARLPPGTLMARAAAGLAAACGTLLRQRRGKVTGSRVLVWVGSGNNGADAMLAGAALAARGARVDAIVLSERVATTALGRLHAAGGRSWPAGDAAGLQRRADLVLDGIVGIGGRGGLREAAARLVQDAAAGPVPVVAVDVPSGVDADTGIVAGAAVTAVRTVTFGCLTPGLLLAPGREHVGQLQLVDIGLGQTLPETPAAWVVDAADAARQLPGPGPADHKYRRGVVGVVAGSAHYRGAALLCTGAARVGGAGMVRYVDRDDATAAAVVRAYPDVVAVTGDPVADGRVTAWVVGPGLGTGADGAAVVAAVLRTDHPVVLDADALALLASQPGLTGLVRDRGARGATTVLTPHDGEFSRLGLAIGDGGRLAATDAAATALRAVVVLKGSGTVVAPPGGPAYLDALAPPQLATAGSGDVLAGLVGSMLAARRPGTAEQAAATVAAAVHVHGRAAVLAGSGGRPVTALDVLDALPAAVATVRRAASPGLLEVRRAASPGLLEDSGDGRMGR